MSNRFWNWPQMPSMTATKYLKYGYVTERPFEPGQRYRNRMDMEHRYPQYREIQRDLRAVSEELEYRRMRSPERELSPPCTFRNCPIGYTSNKGYGNDWSYRFYPSVKSFSPCIRQGDFSPAMPNLYRYYGTRIYY